MDLEKPSNTSHLTTVQKIDNDVDLTNTNLPIEPVLYWDLVHALYQKFESIIKSCCDVNILQAARSDKHSDQCERAKSIRSLIKHVADIVWNTLSKSQYKDRPHLQSIYSYLTGMLRFFFTLLRILGPIYRPNIQIVASGYYAGQID